MNSAAPRRNMGGTPIAVSLVTPYIGRMPDGDVAALTGVDVDAVRRIRVAAGVAPFRVYSVAHLQERVGAWAVKRAATFTIRDYTDDTGTRTDIANTEIRAAYHAGILRKLSVGRRTFWEAVTEGPTPDEVVKAKASRSRKPMLDAGPWLHMLGTQPDLSIAALAECNESTVRNWRKRRGIPSYSERKQASAPPPTAAAIRRKARKAHGLLAVTMWARRWDDEHDRPFLATTYADDVDLTVAEAVRRIEKAVNRGEITEIDKHRPGVCGCYVVAE